MKIRTCDWYGESAVILRGNRKDGYTLLVGGGYTEEEIRYARKIADGWIPDEDDGRYDAYNNAIVYADPEDWKFQNTK